jgi:hypothetical protein
VLVSFPFAGRPWALPVLVALYRSPEDNRRRGRRHKTPAELMQLLLRVLLRWFPDRHFVLAADSNHGTHALARFGRESQATGRRSTRVGQGRHGQMLAVVQRHLLLPAASLTACRAPAPK